MTPQVKHMYLHTDERIFATKFYCDMALSR